MVPRSEAIEHMLAFIDELALHAPTDPAEIQRDLVRSRFVLHTRTLIGEAARRLGPEFHAAHPEVPWARVLGTRNRIVHEYDRVDYGIVGPVLASELPPLRVQLATLLATLSPDDES